MNTTVGSKRLPSLHHLLGNVLRASALPVPDGTCTQVLLMPLWHDDDQTQLNSCSWRKSCLFKHNPQSNCQEGEQKLVDSHTYSLASLGFTQHPQSKLTTATTTAQHPPTPRATMKKAALPATYGTTAVTQNKHTHTYPVHRLSSTPERYST